MVVPKEKNNSFAKFIKEQLKEHGRSQASIADALDVRQQALYTWINTGAFPADKLEAFARELKISVAELKKRGVELKRPFRRTTFIRTRLTKGNKTEDIMPFLRNIVDCGIKSITYNDFMFLIDIQGRFAAPLSPELIREILKNKEAGGS